jgi:hypothetical protein
MVYSNNLVVAISVNGQILRENQNTVQLPFGSEYRLEFKNKNTRKALVKVEIDGQNVTEHGLIFEPGNAYSLEGFKKGLEVISKFKFIEKTKQISNYRGDRIDDGIITVKYQFERQIPRPTVMPTIPWSDIKHEPNLWFKRSRTRMSLCTDDNIQYTTQAYNAACIGSADINLDGITVHGSDSNQTFIYGSIGSLEPEEYVINIKLLGYHNNKPVKQAITVKQKLQCSTCGTKHKSYFRFCNQCGTKLGI